MLSLQESTEYTTRILTHVENAMAGLERSPHPMDSGERFAADVAYNRAIKACVGIVQAAKIGVQALPTQGGSRDGE